MGNMFLLVKFLLQHHFVGFILMLLLNNNNLLCNLRVNQLRLFNICLQVMVCIMRMFLILFYFHMFLQGIISYLNFFLVSNFQFLKFWEQYYFIILMDFIKILLDIINIDFEQVYFDSFVQDIKLLRLFQKYNNVLQDMVIF